MKVSLKDRRRMWIAVATAIPQTWTWRASTMGPTEVAVVAVPRLVGKCYRYFVAETGLTFSYIRINK